MPRRTNTMRELDVCLPRMMMKTIHLGLSRLGRLFPGVDLLKLKLKLNLRTMTSVTTELQQSRPRTCWERKLSLTVTDWVNEAWSEQRETYPRTSCLRGLMRPALHLRFKGTRGKQFSCISHCLTEKRSTASEYSPSVERTGAPVLCHVFSASSCRTLSLTTSHGLEYGLDYYYF